MSATVGADVVDVCADSMEAAAGMSAAAANNFFMKNVFRLLSASIDSTPRPRDYEPIQKK
jgi:hypothetical protein